jgi:hypothetical protein
MEREMELQIQSSRLATLPDEMKLSIIYNLDYHDVLRLRATNHNLHNFLSDSVLQECRQRQINGWAEEEREGAFPNEQNEIPCYGCLKMKPRDHFWNKDVQQYYSTHYEPNSLRDVTQRRCIPCAFDNNEYSPGTQLHIGTSYIILCAACGNLKTEQRAGVITKVCDECKQAQEARAASGYSLRFGQWFFAIIAFSLACTGAAVPKTSVATYHSLRFIFTALVCLLTIGGTTNSLLIRGNATNRWSYRTLRSENNKFVFRVELCAAMSWTAILVFLLKMGAENHLTGQFDRFAKTLVAFELFECMLFWISAWWAYKTSWQRRKVTKKFGVWVEVP